MVKDAMASIYNSGYWSCGWQTSCTAYKMLWEGFMARQHEV